MSFLRWARTLPGNLATIRPGVRLVKTPWYFSLYVRPVYDAAEGWHFDWTGIEVQAILPWVLRIGLFDSN